MKTNHESVRDTLLEMKHALSLSPNPTLNEFSVQQRLSFRPSNQKPNRVFLLYNSWNIKKCGEKASSGKRVRAFSSYLQTVSLAFLNFTFTEVRTLMSRDIWT